MKPVPHGEPYAGKLHVRFDEGADVPCGGVSPYSTPHCIPQTELAKRMKVSRPYITKVLHQDVNITFRTAEKLATALRMDFFPDLRPREVTQKLPNMV